MSMASSKDVPMIVISPFSTSERRITPAWTISQLKSKLEPITGIPASSQQLSLQPPGASQEHASDVNSLSVSAGHAENTTQLANWQQHLLPYAELHVTSSTPTSALPANVTLTSESSEAVAKATMPIDVYTALPGTVHAYKRAHQIGRFDPNALDKLHAKAQAMHADVQARNIEVGRRCHLIYEDTRRGCVRYLGEIPGLPGPKGGLWIGIEFDEPVGKGDGSVEVSIDNVTNAESPDSDDDMQAESQKIQSSEPSKVKRRERYFTCRDKHSAFVRPERVVVGDFPPLEDEDFEEI